jgi:hypothetical protein
MMAAFGGNKNSKTARSIANGSGEFMAHTSTILNPK